MYRSAEIAVHARRFRLLADNPELRESGDLSGLSAFDAMLVGGASDFDWRTGSALAALSFPNDDARAAIVREVAGSLPLEEVWGVYYATTSKQVRWLLRTAIDRRELYRDDSHAARIAEERVAAIADLEPLDLEGLSDEDAAGFRAFSKNLLRRELGLPHELTPEEAELAEVGCELVRAMSGDG